MKKLITYLSLIFCLSVNAQADKVIEATENAQEITNEWLLSVEYEMKSTNEKLQNLTSLVNSLSDQLTQLTIKSWRDSLRLEQMSKRLDYTQSFIKDSVVFVVDSVVEPVLEVNLLGPLHNIGSAWSVNHNGSYKYNHTIANYSYVYFDLKENLKPQTTYIISFTIQLADPSRDALINFWFYDEASNQRLLDGYYKEGKHTFKYTVEGAEKLRMGIRARNNNGGSFDLLDLKVVEQ